MRGLKGPAWHRFLHKHYGLLRRSDSLDNNPGDAENRLGGAFRGDKFL